MLCYKHPKEETNLSCGKCDRPICTRCMVMGPAGIRCPECASLRGTTLYQVAPIRMLAATVVGLVLGLGGVILYSIGFFTLFVSPLYGGFVGDMVLRASGRKRGRALEAIAVGGIILGGVLGIVIRVLPFVHMAAARGGSVLDYIGFTLLWPIIGVCLAVSSCYTRMHYM